MMNQRKNDDGRGLVFNIQKFSLHDGSGIRTLVFLKGCPLTCEWCSNPEGQSYSRQLAFNENKCIGTIECGICIKACDRTAIKKTGAGKIEIDRLLCDDCGECVDACPSKALELFGKHMTVDEVISIGEEDSSFYARSGGGLTLSGGEPLSQPTFVVELLKRAQSRGIDTALETSGLCAWEDLEAACHHTNEVFYDIKSVNPHKHRSHAGVGNAVILENFQKLCAAFPDLPITVRTPVIPGFNDSPEDIREIALFLKKASASVTYELLAYHRFGEPKYGQLGKAYALEHIEPPGKEHMERLRRVVDEHILERCS